MFSSHISPKQQIFTSSKQKFLKELIFLHMLDTSAKLNDAKNCSKMTGIIFCKNILSGPLIP